MTARRSAIARLLGVPLLVSFLAASLVCTAAIQQASAHPLHTTITEITVDPQRRMLRVMIRVFADDLGKVAGGGPSVEGAALSPRSAAYVRRTFAATYDARPVTLQSCGTRRSGELLWICLEAPAPTEMSRLRLTNVMLCDLFSDQVNVVRAALAGTTVRTVLFTKGDRLKPLT